MSGPRVGWVLGFGSLVHPDDPLVRRLSIAGLAIPGKVAGVRRTWTAGLVNSAPEHDGKHHLDPDGTRPDLVVAALSADLVTGEGVREIGVDPGEVVDVRHLPAGEGRGPRSAHGVPALNVLALPVDADGLARTDARERGYERIDVADRFVADAGAGVPARAAASAGAVDVDERRPEALDGPAWIYTASEASREDVARASAEGRAVVSRAYVELVEAAFRARGTAAWDAYRASTDVPSHPLRDLRLHRPGVLPGE